jgi:Tfp pilus assembly protein PilO
MMRFILPLFFVAAAAGLFFGYLDPAYTEVQTLREEVAVLDEALERVREAQTLQERLLTDYNSFDAADIERLHKLLPLTVDNVRLVLGLDDIAALHGLRVQNIELDTAESGDVFVAAPEQPYQSIMVTFTVEATYTDFLAFIEDLESSLRLVDIHEVLFEIAPTGSTNVYQVSIETYWLN